MRRFLRLTAIPVLLLLWGTPLLAVAQPHLEFASQWGGTAQAVDVVGTTVYLGQGPRLVVLDATDPTAPVEIGRSDPLPSVIADVTVDCDYAYVAADLHGLRILSLADPSHPVEVGALLPEDAARAVVVDGDIAYVADRYAGLSVISVEDRTAPELLACLPTSGSASDLALDGDILYVTDRENGLHVIDVSDPAQPVEIATLESVGRACAIALDTETACVVDEGGWLHVVSVRDPAVPRLLASVEARYPQDVAILGSVAYVSPGWSEIVAVSIADPADPVEIGIVAGASGATALTGNGERLYAACGELGLRILSSAFEPVSVVGTWDDAAYGSSVCATDGIVCLGGSSEGIHVVSIADPELPLRLGFVPSPNPNAMVLDSSTLYALCDDDLLAIDLTDPSAPVELSRLELPGTGTGIGLLDDVAVISTEYAGVLVVSIGDPAAPAMLAQLPIDGYGLDLRIVGDLAYVAASGIAVVSLADLTQPRVLGILATGRPAYSIVLIGDTAYLGESSSMRIVSVADPLQPVELGLHVFGLGTRLATTDGLVIAGLGWQGVRLVDPSDPSDVEWLARFDTAGHARTMAVMGDLIFVADEDGGLVILRVVE